MRRFVIPMEIDKYKPIVIVLVAGEITRCRASGPDLEKLDAPLGAMRVRNHFHASGQGTVALSGLQTDDLFTNKFRQSKMTWQTDKRAAKH